MGNEEKGLFEHFNQDDYEHILDNLHLMAISRERLEYVRFYDGTHGFVAYSIESGRVLKIFNKSMKQYPVEDNHRKNWVRLKDFGAAFEMGPDVIEEIEEAVRTLE